MGAFAQTDRAWLAPEHAKEVQTEAGHHEKDPQRVFSRCTEDARGHLRGHTKLGDVAHLAARSRPPVTPGVEGMGVCPSDHSRTVNTSSI